jgi:predicted site-specific integrase-resolvase
MLRTQGYLRVKEAAKLLGVSPNTVRAWGAAGKIPEYRHPANRAERPAALSACPV